MFGMYSNAGVLFLWEQPARSTATATTRADEERVHRVVALNTDHPHVYRAGPAQDPENPLFVPTGPVLGDIEPEAVIGEIAIEDRRLQIGETAREDECRQGHRPPEEHPAFEHDRDERRQRYVGLSADVDRPIERGGPDLEGEPERRPAQSHDQGHVGHPRLLDAERLAQTVHRVGREGVDPLEPVLLRERSGVQQAIRVVVEGEHRPRGARLPEPVKKHAPAPWLAALPAPPPISSRSRARSLPRPSRWPGRSGRRAGTT